jgi:serine/threonine protein kinase HipA of HipAB toxin-antitoxin module
MRMNERLIEQYEWYGPHLAYLGLTDKFESTRANLEGANLEGANLRDAHLEYANLRGANLEGANLRDAHLEYANLEGANLEGANLEGAHLRDAHLRDAHLEGANIRGANLRGANLEVANLEGANIRGANIRGANFRGAKSGSLCRMDFGGWSICIREDKTTIGCQTMDNSFWIRAKPKDVASMAGDAKEWWSIHGSAIKATIKVVMEKAK